MWPEGNDPFCETTKAYASGLVELDRTLKRMVFESYRVDSQKCESFLQLNNYVLRFYKYLPTKKDDGEVGAPSHKDSTFFTILHQLTEGLEVRNKHGQWVKLEVSPSMFCVFAGDAFMVWSNDRIRGAYHQVIIKSKTQPRYSMGLLSYGADTLHTAEELIDDEHPLLYKPFNHYQYLPFIYTDEALNAECRIKAFCGI